MAYDGIFGDGNLARIDGAAVESRRVGQDAEGRPIPTRGQVDGARGRGGMRLRRRPAGETDETRRRGRAQSEVEHGGRRRGRTQGEVESRRSRANLGRGRWTVAKVDHRSGRPNLRRERRAVGKVDQRCGCPNLRQERRAVGKVDHWCVRPNLRRRCRTEREVDHRSGRPNLMRERRTEREVDRRWCGWLRMGRRSRPQLGRRRRER